MAVDPAAIGVTIVVNTVGLDAALKDLSRLSGESHQAVSRAMTRVANVAHRDARANAPRSPSAAQLRQQLKDRAFSRKARNVSAFEATMEARKMTGRKKPLTPKQRLAISVRAAKAAARRERGIKRGAAKRRSDRATSRPSPGGLERSIERLVTGAGDLATSTGNVDAIIFVSANSEAGRYAARIHDGKGTEWWNRGPGTVAKGARADEKFVERAVVGNDAAFLTIVQGEIDKVVRAKA